MKAKAAIVQGALALAGLGAAYATWQRPPDLAPGNVSVLSLSRHDLKDVRFESPDRTVVLTPGELNGDPVVWVDEDEHPTKPAHPGSAKPTAAWHRVLVGNAQAEKLLSQLTSLDATRALGKLPAAKLAELGLASPKRHLVVQARGARHAFEVSTEAGVERPYLRRERDGEVFLLGGMLIADLDGPMRLVDRTLHDFPPDGFDQMAVEVNGKRRTFNASVGHGAFLPELTAEGEAKPTPAARAWHDLLWRSRAVELLGKGELPPGGAPTPLARVEYSRRGRSMGFTELARSGSEVYARSEHTAGWVKLGGPVDDLVRQLTEAVGK